MRLTTRGRYAVTAVLDLALHGNQAPVPLAVVAERQGLSPSYLEQLFGKLKRAGILASVRGPGGGYKIVPAHENLNVSQIISAVGEGLDATQCGGNGDCHDGHQCLTHDLWADLSQQIDLFLSRITLAALVKRGEVVSLARRQEMPGLIVAKLL